MLNRFIIPFLAAGLFVLPACQTDRDATVGVMDDTLATDPMGPGVGDVSAERTASLLETGVTTISPQAALDDINNWINRLQTADFDNASSIRSNLESLRSELQGQIDGNRVADLLESLGNETTEAAQGMTATGAGMGTGATGTGGTGQATQPGTGTGATGTTDGTGTTGATGQQQPGAPGTTAPGTMGAQTGTMGNDRESLMRLGNALLQAAQQLRGGQAGTGMGTGTGAGTGAGAAGTGTGATGTNGY